MEAMNSFDIPSDNISIILSKCHLPILDVFAIESGHNLFSETDLTIVGSSTLALLSL